MMNNRLFLAVFSFLSLMPSWALGNNSILTNNLSAIGEDSDVYTLTLISSPTDGGWFYNSTLQLAAGERHNVVTNCNQDFVFINWTMGDSVLSTDNSFYFDMPAHDTLIVAHFEYNPVSPVNPNANYWNSQTGEIIIDDFTPGRLGDAISAVISGSNRRDVTMITVAGQMNNNDFGVTHDYSNCTLFDICRVSGISQVPSHAFYDTNFESVFLPASIEKIGFKAFSDCKKLSSLTLYAMMPPTLENNVFENVPEGLVVYVPAAAIAQYQDAEGWKDFTLLPIQEDIRNITVSLPEGANVVDYSNLWLELTNTKSGQRIRYILTDRTTYTFANIIRNTSWNVTVLNERGDVFGKIENVEVKDEDVSVTFVSLKKPQNVSLSVRTPDGMDVTDKVQVIWTDSSDNYLSQGPSFYGLPSGVALKYSMTLPKELAMQYHSPMTGEYTIGDGGNNIPCQLIAYGKTRILGKVKDAETGLPLRRATVSVSQTYTGKYNKTLNANTDNQGTFMLMADNVSTSISFSASDYISQALVCDSLIENKDDVVLPDILLNPINGAIIELNLNYTPCLIDSDEEETINLYNDYQNVDYSIYNVSKGHSITHFIEQFPLIILQEEVDNGDELLLTASSRTSGFMPVESVATVVEQRATANFVIRELGKIQASIVNTGNASVVGSLYDSAGKLIKTYNYSESSLTINDLIDGHYTLVSMGSSRLFNTIYALSQLPQTGLVKGIDYVQNTVDVQSGIISKIKISEVPTLDESKFKYTGDNTSFTVNKPSIVSGNFLTLTGHIDFKPAYASSVNNVQMIVDLPEDCIFVENSVIVGNSISGYTMNGNQVTIPMAHYSDRVRFCIIPVRSGDYAPSAFVHFNMDGETIEQPIGSANFLAKGLSIIVPSIVATTTIPISGTAVGKSSVDIYDDGVLIGQTISLPNGNWATMCTLNEPYNLSTHSIYAKVTSETGIQLVSETKDVKYNMTAIEPLKVTMINVAHPASSLKTCEYVTEFDFTNPSKPIPAYWYWPNYPDFTFLVDFTRNDVSLISNVKLHVLLTDQTVVTLSPQFDSEKNCWVATKEFQSSALPVNVNVTYSSNTQNLLDRQMIDDANLMIDEEIEASMETRRNLLSNWNSIGSINEEAIFIAIDSLLSLSVEEMDIDLLNQYLSAIVHTTETTDMDIDSLLMVIDADLKADSIEYVSLNNDFENLVNQFIYPYDEPVIVDGDFNYSISTFGGISKFEKQYVETIDEEQLLNEGYEKITLTDNSFIFCLQTQDSQIIIDTRDRIRYELRIEENASEITKLMGTKDLSDCIDNLKTSVFTLSDYMDLLEMQGDLAEFGKVVEVYTSMLKKTFSFLGCVYSSGLEYLDYLLYEYVSDTREDINKEISETLLHEEDIEKCIGTQRKKLNGLFKSHQNLSDDIEKYIANMNNPDLANLEDWQQKIDNAKEALKNLKNEIDLESKKLVKYDKKLLEIKKIISNLNIKLLDVDLVEKKTKAFISLFPRSLESAIKKKSLRMVGNIAKAIGTPIGSVLQIIPITVGLNDLIKESQSWVVVINEVLKKYPCEGDPLGWDGLAITTGAYAGDQLLKRSSKVVLDIKAMQLDFTCNWLASLGFDAVSWFMEKLADANGPVYRNSIRAKLKNLKCDEDEEDEEEENESSIDWPFSSVSPVMDPSGFVYESVISNRIEGVRATAYYKETVEDMYGDLHENIVKWDAAEYAQENPLFTDEYGMYAWDVPQGLWQVKFEKEGYETTYSEWLPVPPPQLDINIAMTQNRQPEVKTARAYEDAVEVEFDKYMMPEFLTTENISVMQAGKPVDGSIVLLNEEARYEGETETFASKVRFNASQPFTEQEITLLVNNRVKSYAGIRMQDNYQQEFTVEKEIKQILSDSLMVVEYGDIQSFIVSVLPASASAGKTLTVNSSSPLILEVETKEVTIDNTGKAEIIVSGELPGTAALTLSIEGTDKNAVTIVNVVQNAIKTVALPIASIASGSVVEKGAEISLSCSTKGSTIYYTLDGSCPCDDTPARKVYDGSPIIITQSVTIKAMATAPDMYDSEIAEFTYIVKDGEDIEELYLDPKVQIYPLPIKDVLNVKAGGHTIKYVSLTAINGVMSIMEKCDAQQAVLDVSSLPSGVYIINVATDDNVYSSIVVK